MPANHDTPSRPTAARTVRCPACGGHSLYAPTNAYRPFCSERCKNVDLGAWASESYRVAAEPPEDPDAVPADRHALDGQARPKSGPALH